MDLWKPQRIAVSDEGEIVTLTLGNTPVDMHYEVALQVSTWMRVHAKACKARAGDGSRHWSVIGNLTDVLNGGQPWGKG